MRHLSTFALFESKHRYSVGQILPDEDAQLIVDLLKDLINLGINPDIQYTTPEGSSIEILLNPSNSGHLANINVTGTQQRLIIRKSIIDPASPSKMDDGSLCSIIKHELAHNWQNAKFFPVNDLFTGGKGKKFILNYMKKKNAYKELIGDKSYSMDELEIGANLAPLYDSFKIWIQNGANQDLAKDALRKGDLSSIFLDDEGALGNNVLFQQMFLFYFGEIGEPLPGGTNPARASMKSGDFKKYRPELHRKVLKSFLVALSSILDDMGAEEPYKGQVSISNYNFKWIKSRGLWDKYENKVSVE
jgi:hypothetical protein